MLYDPSNSEMQEIGNILAQLLSLSIDLEKCDDKDEKYETFKIIKSRFIISYHKKIETVEIDTTHNGIKDLLE